MVIMHAANDQFSCMFNVKKHSSFLRSLSIFYIFIILLKWPLGLDFTYYYTQLSLFKCRIMHYVTIPLHALRFWSLCVSVLAHCWIIVCNVGPIIKQHNSFPRLTILWLETKVGNVKLAKFLKTFPSIPQVSPRSPICRKMFAERSQNNHLFVAKWSQNSPIIRRIFCHQIGHQWK